MTTAEPATEVRAMPTYIAIPASKVLGEVVVLVLPSSGLATEVPVRTNWLPKAATEPV